MLFTYTFGEKLDLDRFRQHALRYVSYMEQVTYDIYLLDYKIIADIVTKNRSHLTEVTLYEIGRDGDKEISFTKVVYPQLDARFKECQAVQDIWCSAAPYVDCKASFVSNRVADIVDKICALIKLVHKINSLKAFA